MITPPSNPPGFRRVCAPVARAADPETRAKHGELSALWQGLRHMRAPDPKTLQTDLNARLPHQRDLVDWILGERALAELCASDAGPYCPPLLLVGPPGSGKTTAAMMIAETLSAPFHVLNAAATSDARSLLGTSAGFSTGTPALPVAVMARRRCANPVLIVDELDKAGTASPSGSWPDALLAFLEPRTATGYFDEFLGTDVDCSHITWIATANSTRPLPAHVLSRFHVLAVQSQGVARQTVFDLAVSALAQDIGLSGDTLTALLGQTDLPDWPDDLRACKRRLRERLCTMLHTRALH